MKTTSKYLGLVTKKFNDFFLIDLKNQENFENSEKFLCKVKKSINCLLYTSPSPRDISGSRMPSSA